VPFALKTLGIQMVILGVELERNAGLFLVRHHEVQVLAVGAANESGLARVESQHEHSNAVVLMKKWAAQLLTLEIANQLLR
jgi:hypothetical protein